MPSSWPTTSICCRWSPSCWLPPAIQPIPIGPWSFRRPKRRFASDWRPGWPGSATSASLWSLPKERCWPPIRMPPSADRSRISKGVFATACWPASRPFRVPFRSLFLLPNAKGELKPNLPTMFTAAAIHGDDGKPVAALALRIAPDKDFTRILQIAQSGKTGETYAFDKDGLLLSESRFDEELKRIGLLVDEPGRQSILTVTLRDPGVNMAAGERSVTSRRSSR